MRLFLAFCVLLLNGWISFPAHGQDLDVTDIVNATDTFTADPSDANRTALVVALEAYTGEATVQSVNAYVRLLMHDASGESGEHLVQSATLATAHLEPVADILPKQYLEARFLAAVARFNDDPVPDLILEMAHVEGRARAYTDELGEQPDWADSLKWKADAWGMAMEAYFDSARKRSPSDAEINAILATYPVPQDAADESTDGALPQCSGRMIQRPKMKYPTGKAMRGMYGAVILGFELDPDGRVVNPEILASVPIEEFDERSLQTVGKWRFKPDDPDQVGISCRLERSNVVQPLIFQIG